MGKGVDTKGLWKPFNEARERLGMSIPKVAKASGTNDVSIYNLRAGKNMYRDTVEKLFLAVGLHLGDFLDGRTGAQPGPQKQPQNEPVGSDKQPEPHDEEQPQEQILRQSTEVQDGNGGKPTWTLKESVFEISLPNCHLTAIFTVGENLVGVFARAFVSLNGDTEKLMTDDDLRGLEAISAAIRSLEKSIRFETRG